MSDDALLQPTETVRVSAAAAKPPAPPEYDIIRDLCGSGQLLEAWERAEAVLDADPNKANPLILASYVCWKMKKLSVAYHLAVRATQLAPHESAAWCNLGINAHELWLTDESEEAYKVAWRLAGDDRGRGMAAMNMAALLIDTGRWRQAEEWSRRAIKHSPHSEKAKANLGFALLGQRKWQEGWKFYSHSLGLESRMKMKLRDEPDWDGKKGQTVALYGEQGLGDELSFASMLPDAIRDSKKVVIDCDPMLRGLFARSFPAARVYGTRNARASDNVKWDRADWAIDASLAFGELGGLYRKRDEDFTGAPYLVADPIRSSMWHWHFVRVDSRPVIGVAWTGGLRHTGAQFRTLTLEELAPLLQSVDARWVSLQYKDASEEISAFKQKYPLVDLVQYPWATLTRDYDDTAALVAQLDLVVAMQTAVVHLAGALGKECWVFLPKNSQWRYGADGERTPWYASVRIFRQRSLRDWHGPMGEVTGELRRKFNLPVAEAA